MQEPAPLSSSDHDLDVVAIGSPLLDVIAMATEAQLAEVGLEKGSMTLVDLVKAKAVQGSMDAPASSPGVQWPTRQPASPNSVVGPVLWARLPMTRWGGRTPATCERLASSSNPASAQSAAGDGLGTGRCVVLITDDADRTMGTYLGAASTLSPAGVSTPFVARASVVLLEGYLWDVPAAKEAMRHAAATAHGSNGSVALSLSDPFCVERHKREFLDLLLDDVDILLGNEEEVTMLFGVSSYDSPALEAADETGLLVVMTRGAPAGTHRARRRRDRRRSRPLRSSRVVDTTGAGRPFRGRHALSGLTHGMGPVESTRLGGLCAAEVISHTGARPEADLKVPGGCSRLAAGLARAVSLSIGIVGLPNVGKSTLFNALTTQRGFAANYPFATIEPNVGVVGVPDARLESSDLYA